MIERTEIGDAMIGISSDLLPISENEYFNQVFQDSTPLCAVRGCKRRAVGVTKVRLVYKKQFFASSHLYFMPLCHTCHNLKSYHLGQQLWELKENYPLLITY